MKKIFLILTLSFILFSCSNKEENNDNSPTTSSWNIIINTWSLNNTGAINQTLTWTNTEVKVEEIIKVKKEIRKEDNNLSLYEGNKKIWTLTTYWNTENIDTWKCWNNEKTFISYDIISQDENFGVVEKHIYTCWMDRWTTEYFAMNFNNSKVELTNITEKMWYSLEKANSIKYINWSVIITFLWNSVVDWYWDPFTAWIEELKEDGFSKNWNDWTKIIDLNTFLKPSEKIESDNKYSEENLLSNWYTLNNIWDIKEYYKTIKSDNNQENNAWWLIEYHTVYLKWDKMLEIIANDYGWWGTSWFIPNITIFDWQNKHYFSANDLYEFHVSLMDILPIQPIFKVPNKAKLLIDNNLDNVKVYDKEQSINAVIWKK